MMKTTQRVCKVGKEMFILTSSHAVRIVLVFEVAFTTVPGAIVVHKQDNQLVGMTPLRNSERQSQLMQKHLWEIACVINRY